MSDNALPTASALPMAYYRHVRQEILPHLPDDPPTGPLRVLEIGCGAGSTLARIRELRPQAWLAGAELMPLDSPLYAQLDHFECLDVEQGLPDVAPGSVDVLLCLDVLEHLRDPLQVLTQLSTLLRPGGRLVASLPNLQYIKVSLPLLFGRFDYTDEGVLDRTHLRFFTRRSALRLLDQAGFEVHSVERLRIRDLRKLMSLLLPLPGWRDLWTKQFLFVGQRRA